MTRLRSVGGKDTTRDSEYPDGEFVAGVLREHPELLPTPKSHIPGWVTRRNALALSLGIVMAFLAVAASSLWAPSGKAPADPPKQQNQPNSKVRHASRPRSSPPLPRSTGANPAPNRATPGPVPPSAGLVPPQHAPTITPPAAPIHNPVPSGGQPSQQTTAVAPAPAATPTPSPTPSVDSVPSPSLLPTTCLPLPHNRCRPAD